MGALVARQERKIAKKESRANIRATKKRDLIIQHQEKSANASHRVRDELSDKRAAFDGMQKHMQTVHQKQTMNLISRQERYFESEKKLMELESARMKEEQKSAFAKNFQLRQNHKAHLDKRVLENLRDVQLLEAQHAKDKFELEMLAYEEIQNKQITNQNLKDSTKLRHMSELHAEKEAVLAKNETEKEDRIRSEQTQDLNKLKAEQKREMRILKQRLDEKLNQGMFSSRVASQGGSIVGSKHGSVLGSRIPSLAASKKSSAHSSTHNFENAAKINIHSGLKTLLAEETEEDNGDEEEILEGNNKIPRSILLLMSKQKKEYHALDSELKKQLNDCRVAFDAKMDELNESQRYALETVVTEQERLLKEMKEVQEKEIIFEETMTANEMKMLIERRILNSVLQTVGDGIICISPTGIIIKFNFAAEMIFGWTAKEVLGKNIKMLTPSEHASKHDQYIKNYLSTGIKKVIGIGRNISGKRKNGQLIPIHLSLSEVKEHGAHMFTGIVHDLTNEVREREAQRVKDLQKKKELEDFVELLDKENNRCSSLLSEILPPAVSEQLLNGLTVVPEIFESVTVLYFDIVEYTKLSSSVSAGEIVELLNRLYSGIDRVIEQYDAYKVETVGINYDNLGDCFIIASGTPRRNNTHAIELTKMALHLIKAVEAFVYKPNPEIKIKIRVGLHSGMVVGGVVGHKMPKYCLFVLEFLFRGKQFKLQTRWSLEACVIIV
jgi:PAS domain S-box-containing protein